MSKKVFPTIHFYDQDFVDIYNQTWAWMEEFWLEPETKSPFSQPFMTYDVEGSINQIDACFSTFYLVYSNRNYSALPILDNFYDRQEADGAIRSEYSIADGKAVSIEDNPESVALPLFSWAEYNLYHKLGNKKRIKDILPILEAYFSWLETNFKDETGMYVVPASATGMVNSPRNHAKYFVDFNAVQAINALYMSELGDILNDKEISFKYKRHYFSLKTQISQKMWNEETGVYMDLDENQNQIGIKTIATFWPLLAEIPNDHRFDKLKEHLKNPETFGTPNPFPSLAANEPEFQESGQGYKGSVFPHLTFMVIKGLEKYAAFDFARESSIRHLYYMLDTLHPEGSRKGNVWEAYKPTKDGAAEWDGNESFPRPKYLAYVGLSTVSLMIENIIGLYISLPRKTVDWIVPTLEAMGIEDLSLKRNLVTILSSKSNRGWEIRLESEKLYYFTIDILGNKKKTLPIPSGKCSMLIDKL